MINDDAATPDDFERVDSFDDLDANPTEESALRGADSFDDLDGTGNSPSELDHVDSFGDLEDDLVIQGNAPVDEPAVDEPAVDEPVIEALGPQEPLIESLDVADDDADFVSFPTVEESVADNSPKEEAVEQPLPSVDDDPAESESVAVSEEISIAGESESAAVSQEIEEVAACARLVITPAPETMMTGEQITFSVEAFDKANNPVEAPTVRWTAKGGEITRAGVYTAGRSTGLFSVKASTKGLSDRLEGMIEAAPSRNEWVLASFFSACGIYLALGLTYVLDPTVLGPAKNFIGIF